MKRIFIILSFMLTFPVFAKDCYEMAGRKYNIDPDLLRAISFRESSWRPQAMNVISDEKYAVGLMQIHSQNFPHLAKFGITPDDLSRDPCLNIFTGTYFLGLAFKRWGYSWRAVGAYNAGFRETETQEKRRVKYALEVSSIYENLKRNQKPSPAPSITAQR
ncbi:transglycosylase SLT domain-containing protein [Erwinia tracheiphila]|uniref:Lytic transglycosylase n=1 Tax=Erwinia tracheiphila TaxID=65700 RepID=A0A0M2KAD8_9GAMM|nr:transglycosylase SLT domain-containing protein [Erwinia tracheiphila]EOS93902.1 X polypeptide [Erwinia tracheiphila PSU-1]KKF35894.1 lytic transglycosylase [Erwinia tracheiphila]UIA87212.1 transglycosylase SLT domain-containing protein [Erwinia tracheiphila]UIA95573.1 transglycosylase SLT domain-containing protein [Erwinia tracheiphila]